MITAVLRVTATNARLLCGRLVHGDRLRYSPLTCLALSDSVALSTNAEIDFGRGLRTRGGCSFNVQGSGCLSFGEEVFLNRGCMLNCRKTISVGDGCEFGPNVLVYDHDHVFENGKLKDGIFKYRDVKIGKNCWIGAGTIILRGSILGDNCVVAAGSVLKGEYPPNSLVLQSRVTETRQIGSDSLLG